MFFVDTNAASIPCKSYSEIAALLESRKNQPGDEVWVAGDEPYPCLLLLFQGDAVNVHYFLEEEGDLWQSYQYTEDTNEIVFQINGEDTPCPACYVVSWEQALHCIEEFCQTKQLPTCISWEAL